MKRKKVEEKVSRSQKEVKRETRRTTKKNQDQQIIYMITGIFVAMFMLLIGYFIYFTVVKEKQIAVHPQNTRLNAMEKEVIRGTIYDTNMVVLATTENEERTYPRGKLYAHAVGYATNGKTGAEALANTQLLYPDYSVTSLFKAAFLDEKFEGRDVVLTLDDRYQSAVAEAMSGERGGVVILEPSTGKIRAMYASPGFNPNDIAENWDELRTDEKNTPLVNRATQGLYPPGSIFKVVTALAYMEKQGDESLDFTYNCTGEVSGDDYTIQCYDHIAHGEVNLETAFAKSCNSYFVKLGEQLSVGELKAAAEKLGFNKDLSFDMAYSKSKFQLTSSDSEFEKAATAIGQGRTLVTPLHMAMVAGMIANDGVSMKPYLMDYSMSKKGSIKVKNMPTYEGAVLDEATATKLQKLMLAVTANGTASSLSYNGMTVGGKTGTAQNETSADHSWFMGFAKDDADTKDAIAFAVVVEGGAQSVRAVSVVQKILNVYSEVKP
nr:penicillin-binding transpeptidase domain-containing protein [uncultured Cellulosilyticum sp.]